jgi:hypothetical protein
MKYFSLFIALLPFAAWLIGVYVFDASGFFHLLLIPAAVILSMRLMEGSMELKKYQKHKEF